MATPAALGASTMSARLRDRRLGPTGRNQRGLGPSGVGLTGNSPEGVGLAERHPLVAQDVVGGRDAEAEAGECEVQRAVTPREGKGPATQPDGDRLVLPPAARSGPVSRRKVAPWRPAPSVRAASPPCPGSRPRPCRRRPALGARARPCRAPPAPRPASPGRSGPLRRGPLPCRGSPRAARARGPSPRPTLPAWTGAPAWLRGRLTGFSDWGWGVK